MTNTNSQIASENAVLEQAIEILKKLGGKATAAQIYEQFATVLGHPVDETEANNIYQILTNSSAAACRMQPDGKCLYINSADDQTFVLDTNEEAKTMVNADTASMNDALKQANDPKGYVLEGSHQSDAVVEPGQLIDADGAAAKDQEKVPHQVKDVEADAQADIDAAKAAAKPDSEDKKIDRLAKREERDDHKIEVEKERIAKHEEQIAHDKTKLMKDFHEMEIHHDEKVIAREEKRLEELDEKIVKE